MTDVKEKYIVLDMIPIKQLDSGTVLTGKIKFSELNQVYKITVREEVSHDNAFGDAARKSEEEGFFQRQFLPQKRKEVKDFLECGLKKGGGSLAVFPSSVILYTQAYEYDDLVAQTEITDLNERIIVDSHTTGLTRCFYVPSDEVTQPNFAKIYIPKNKNVTLIVDGQHRFLGTKDLYDSLPDGSENKDKVGNFEFIVTFLYGFDIYEVGKIFADVNFTQKPVNRSLYYDIFGAAPFSGNEDKRGNEIRLAHDLAVHLNNSDKSPIKGMIKLLGKGHGLFSQAFFVDHIRDHVFKSKIWNDLLIDYMQEGEKYKVIAVFMRAYFSALQRAYPSSWPEKVVKTKNSTQELVYSSYDYKNVMCKTTGMGAYIRLIKDIYPLVKDFPNQFEDKIFDIFSRVSDEVLFELFGHNGTYDKRSGEGVQGDVYRDLIGRYNLTKQKSLGLYQLT